MRIAACIVGIVGALVGIFFAQLLVTVSMVLSLATSTNGEIELGSEFYLGAGALIFFALGMAGAVVTPIKSALGALLLLISAVGSVVSILSIGGPGPNAFTAGANIAAVVPYVGSALLFVATVLAAIETYETMMVPALPAPTAAAGAVAEMTPAAPVVPTRATLAAAVPMKLLSAPNANAPSKGTLEPGTVLESLEQIGEFVRVRGDGFEGYLPAWAIRR